MAFSQNSLLLNREHSCGTNFFLTFFFFNFRLLFPLVLINECTFETKGEGEKLIKQWVHAILYFCKKGFLNSIYSRSRVFMFFTRIKPTLRNVYVRFPLSIIFSYRKSKTNTKTHCFAPRSEIIRAWSRVSIL